MKFIFVAAESNPITDKYESITASEADLSDFEEENFSQDTLEDDETSEADLEDLDENESSKSGRKAPRRHHPRIDIVSKLLRIVETQALQGANCNPGTDLNLGEKVVNQYAQVNDLFMRPSVTLD